MVRPPPGPTPRRGRPIGRRRPGGPKEELQAPGIQGRSYGAPNMGLAVCGMPREPKNSFIKEYALNPTMLAPKDLLFGN